MPSQETRFVRVQERGQVTLPAEVRRRLGLKKGDVVAVVETDDGVFISPQTVVGVRALGQPGGTLEQQGVTIDELLSPGTTENGIPLRDFSSEEIATFIEDDRLTGEARAAIKRFGDKRPR